MKQFIVPPAPLQMVDTNILGPLAVTQAVVPHMAAQASGKIINVSHSSHRANGAASVFVDVASHPALGSHLRSAMVGMWVAGNFFCPSGSSRCEYAEPALGMGLNSRSAVERP